MLPYNDPAAQAGYNLQNQMDVNEEVARARSQSNSATDSSLVPRYGTPGMPGNYIRNNPNNPQDYSLWKMFTPQTPAFNHITPDLINQYAPYTQGDTYHPDPSRPTVFKDNFGDGSTTYYNADPILKYNLAQNGGYSGNAEKMTGQTAPDAPMEKLLVSYSGEPAHMITRRADFGTSPYDAYRGNYSNIPQTLNDHVAQYSNTPQFKSSVNAMTQGVSPGAYSASNASGLSGLHPEVDSDGVTRMYGTDKYGNVGTPTGGGMASGGSQSQSTAQAAAPQQAANSNGVPPGFYWKPSMALVPPKQPDTPPPYSQSSFNPLYPQGSSYNPLYPNGPSANPLYPQGPGYNALYPNGPSYNPLYPDGTASNSGLNNMNTLKLFSR